MSEICACRALNEHVREKNKCIVAKAVISDSEVKMKLLDLMNLQSMQFDSQVLHYVLKVDRTMT